MEVTHIFYYINVWFDILFNFGETFGAIDLTETFLDLDLPQ